MPTYTLSTGQITQPIEVGARTRITTSGSGYVQWMPGSLADAANSGAWQTWPNGTVAGSRDTVRRIVVRGVATGAFSLTVLESGGDPDPDGRYWEVRSERIPAQVLACLGDSLTANGIANTASNVAHTAYSFGAWANALLGWRFRHDVGDNLGVSGNTLADMYARMYQVLGRNPSHCTIMGGTNDINTGVSFSAMKSSMRSIVSALNDADCVAVVITVPPRDADTSTQRLQKMRWNQWLREFFSANEGAVLCDPFRYLADPTSSTSAWNSGYSTDQTHFTQSAAFWIGKELYNVLNPITRPVANFWPGNADTVDLTNNPTGNLLSNSGFTSTTSAGTGVSGTVGANWTLSRTAGSSTGTTASVQNRTDSVPGKETLITVGSLSGGGSTEEFRIRQGVTAGASTYASGDVVYGQCEIDVSNITALKWCFLYLLDNNGTTNIMEVDCLSSSSNSMPTTAWSGVLRTPNMTVSAYSGSGTQSLSMGLAFAVDGTASGAATVKFRAPTLRRVES